MFFNKTKKHLEKKIKKIFFVIPKQFCCPQQVTTFCSKKHLIRKKKQRENFFEEKRFFENFLEKIFFGKVFVRKIFHQILQVGPIIWFLWGISTTDIIDRIIERANTAILEAFCGNPKQ